MTDFTFQPQAGLVEDTYYSAALGAATNAKLTDLDIGKAVKLIADSRVGVVTDGDEIEGILFSVEPNPVNNGYGFGSVQKKERVVASSTGGTLSVGDYVVAAAQPAVGTAITTVSSGKQTGTKPTPVKAGSPTKFIWRVISLLGGDGTAGTTLLIERI